MVDSNDKELRDVATIAQSQRNLIMQNNDIDPITLIERVYQIWWHWADFHISVINPVIPAIEPAKVIHPEPTADGSSVEFVYPIHDQGYKMSASKAESMYAAGMSMCKMHYTIEKMIYLLIERLKKEGIDTTTEVQVAFGGHELCQRKAFESIINLSYNVVVTNFDPGIWGEQYLEVVKRLADKGYGYPTESPRETFRQAHASPSNPKR